jgi:hypothetical protein
LNKKGSACVIGEVVEKISVAVPLK